MEAEKALSSATASEPSALRSTALSDDAAALAAPSLLQKRGKGGI